MITIGIHGVLGARWDDQPTAKVLVIDTLTGQQNIALFLARSPKKETPNDTPEDPNISPSPSDVAA